MSKISTAITEAFITPVLTPLATDTKPTFATLTLLQTELNQNAQAIDSNAGGNLGHLVLTVENAKYLVMSNQVAFVVPVNPGDTPIIPAGASGPQITEANRVLLVNQHVYNTYKKCDLALKAQALVAIPDKYIRRLKVVNLGYGSCTMLEILTHLWTHYGKIEFKDLQANDELMKAPWHPHTPIDDLFARMQSCLELARADNPAYLEITVVRHAYEILCNTGFFTQDLRTWNDKVQAEWTLDNFYSHFEDADRYRLATTKDAGFHSANATTHLAAAAPTSSISDLAAAKLEIAHLKKQLSNAKVGTPPVGPRTKYYCWTHGTTENWKHSSAKCRNKADGHQDAATAANKMGGSEKVWTAPITPRE